MQMPEMDGVTLALAIKSDPLISATRLLMLTSIGQPDRIEALHKSIIARCLTKPVKQAPLLAAIRIAIASPVETNHALAAPVATQTQLAEHEPVFAVPKRLRILLAEDNPVNQKVALTQLVKMGYQVDAVSNGIEALASLAVTPYPIVLMDCQMPEMDGYEATVEIRRREQGTALRTVVIAMTAHALQGERERCLAIGMDDYLSKPVKATELARMLERWSLSPGPAPLHELRAAAVSLEFSDLDPELFDQAMLEPFRELQDESDADLVGELLGLYVADTRHRMGELRAALKRQDLPSLQSAAHSLKGSSKCLGIRRMSTLCFELEEHLDNGRFTGAAVSLNQLEGEFERVQQALASEQTLV
jgi:CheY-like chemotaxis protein